MEGAYRDKYSFIGEWRDDQANLLRIFIILYYPVDNTIEMFEKKTRKTFLRRLKVDGITLSSFFIGNCLLIFGRTIKILGYATKDTERRIHHKLQTAFVLLKPMPTNIVAKIITHLFEHGLKVAKMKLVQVCPEDINYVYRNNQTDKNFPFTLEHLTNQLVYPVELFGEDAVERCRKVFGKKDPTEAEAGTIRALYGTDPVRNCAYIADEELVTDTVHYFFGENTKLRLTATLSNCTLCIIKPHAIREGKLGRIIESIHDGGFEITACNMIVMQKINAEEFYEIYKGIVPEFNGMVEELSSGYCLAMEVVCKNKSLNSASEFRKLVGPGDPEIARLLRPHTLRAKYGNNKVLNAVHCSDLAEDGLLEVEYLFKILAS